MLARLTSLPLILQLTALFALAMAVPALHGLAQGDSGAARAFGSAAALGLVFVLITGLAMTPARRWEGSDLANLASLGLAYTVMPLFLAVPFHQSLATTSFLNAYFEMVSSLTTTGATLFDDPGRLSASLHLWRGLVGWLGGLMIWVSAAAVLAPMYLGGFELTVRAEPGQGADRIDRFHPASSARRIARIGAQLTPVYAGLTGALWLMLMISGDRPLVAAIHAMSTMATSGISPVGDMPAADSGLAGEMLIFLFLLFALSRQTISSDIARPGRPGLLSDPEFRIGLMLVFGVPVMLFLRHWIGAYELDEGENLAQALRALWGSVFTVLSFLTTTGFESASWGASRDWSGLGTPGLVLMGLAIMGGGVATTAGGVKLLRVYLLYLDVQRETERLIHPRSVSRASGMSRRFRREGAFVAWVFFMLFALSLAAVTIILGGLGQSFEAATVLAIAMLSTTGPLTQAATDTPIDLLQLGGPAKLVLCLSMVVGRLETLAIIPLFNPGLWRE